MQPGEVVLWTHALPEPFSHSIAMRWGSWMLFLLAYVAFLRPQGLAGLNGSGTLSILLAYGLVSLVAILLNRWRWTAHRHLL